MAKSMSASAQTTTQPTVSSSSAATAEESPNKNRDARAPGAVAAEQKSSAGPTGGYSWRSKPTAHKAHAQKQRVDPSRPQAKGPEFTVAADGTSHISVQLSQKVEVSTTTQPTVYTYDLTNAQVAVPNDRNPLVTTHFPTPVSRVKLISHGRDARLILELREPATPQFQIRQLANGGAVLEIALAKPSHTATGAKAATTRKTASHKTKPRH